MRVTVHLELDVEELEVWLRAANADKVPFQSWLKLVVRHYINSRRLTVPSVPPRKKEQTEEQKEQSD